MSDAGDTHIHRTRTVIRRHPRLPRSASEETVDDLRDGLASFCDGLQCWLADDFRNLSVEIVSAVEADGRGRTTIETESRGPTSAVAHLGARVPVHFDVERQDGGEFEVGSLDVGSLETEQPMWFVDLRRRTTFHDLPTRSRPLSGEDRGPENLAVVRVIPVAGIQEDKKLGRRRFTLPSVPPLKDAHHRPPKWVHRMRTFAPCQVRVRAHRLDVTALARDSALFGTFLEWIKAAEGTARDASALEQIREHYERYFNAAHSLCDLTIRIGATDRGRAEAMAHSFLADRRCASALECSEPYLVRSPGELNVASTFQRAHSSESAASVKEDVQRLLESHGARIGSRIGALSALGGMTSIFSFEEAARFLELPWSQGGEIPMPTAPISVGAVPRRSAPTSEITDPRPDVCRWGLLSTGALAAPPGDEIHDLEEACERYALHTQSFDEFCKGGVGIFGQAGTGKTSQLESIIRDAMRNGLDLFVLEAVKPELYDRLGDTHGLRRYRFRGDASGRLGADFPAHDPLRLHPGTTPQELAGQYAEIATGLWAMDESMHRYLKTGLLAYFRDTPERGGCGIPRYAHGRRELHRVGRHVHSYGRAKAGNEGAVFPSTETFFAYFMRVHLPGMVGDLSAELRSEWLNFFDRRFEGFLAGPLGDMCLHADAIARHTWAEAGGPGEGFEPDPFLRLLRGRVILEIDGITDGDERAMVMAFVMSSLFQVRGAQRRARQALQREQGTVGETRINHLFLLDEAHELLANPDLRSRGRDASGMGAREKLVQLFVRALATLRSAGQGLIVSSQLPGSVAEDVLKHSGTLASFRLTSLDDRRAIGNAMGMSEEQIEELVNLRTGQFFLRGPSMSEPAQVTFPGLLNQEWFGSSTDETDEETA